MIKRILGSALGMVVIWVLVAGCGGSGDKTLAVVGDHEITTREFNQNFPGWRFTFASAQDEFDAKRDFLDSMVITRLLIQAAYEKHIDQLEELARVVLANENKFLLNALYQENIQKKAEPTEAEVRDYYNHLEYKLRAAHILLDNLDTAQALLERIRGGENFEKLAYEYSIDTTARQNRGDLGYFVWGVMVDEFQDAAFKLEPGEVSTPVESPFGYHIIKLIDKLPNSQRGDYEDMKGFLKNQLGRRKESIVVKEYLDGIKAKYPISIDTVTCNYLMGKREMIYPPMLLETLPRNDFDPEQLDRDEKELIIATWDGGQMTVMQYLTQAKQAAQSMQMPPESKPDLDNYPGLADFVFTLKTSDILVIEAHRQGVDNSPEYLEKMKLFKELNMADFMRNDSIPKPPPPDDGMARQYYDEHVGEFTTPAKIRVFEILLSDEMKARQLKKEIRSLESFKEKAMDLTERPGKRSAKGDLDYIEEAWFPEIFAVARETAVGRIGGPVATLGKYSIFYVVDKIEPQLKDYLGVKRQIMDKLTSQQRADAFKAWVDERTKSTRVETYDEALWETVDNARYAAADTTSG